MNLVIHDSDSSLSPRLIANGSEKSRFGLSSRLKAESHPATSNRRRFHEFINLLISNLVKPFPPGENHEILNLEILSLLNSLPFRPLAAPVPEALRLHQ
jgi:hypothetical protein